MRTFMAPATQARHRPSNSEVKVVASAAIRLVSLAALAVLLIFVLLPAALGRVL